ncbi:MAG: thiamine diphosphokinase [Bacteroidetes bacterium]|nr:thiamine diphosphokinase [Bacteroidota bacterium]
MNYLIFLNGEIPFHVYHKLFRGQENFIIAADGGANGLRFNKIEPDIITGDLDSIKPEVLEYFSKKGTKIISSKDQETTDFEKTLKYCIEEKIKKIFVFGAVSERPDHTLNNFSVLKRYCRKTDIVLYSEEFEIFFIDSEVKFNYRKNETVSLMPFPKADRIITSGLKYKLNREKLELGKREGSLNLSVSEKVKISYQSGYLLLFKKHFINSRKI